MSFQMITRYLGNRMLHRFMLQELICNHYIIHRFCGMDTKVILFKANCRGFSNQPNTSRLIG